MEVELGRVTSLRFGDGSPVRAASGLARLGDGWLVAQDDATHAAWWRPASEPPVVPVRVLPPVEGLDTFEEAQGTKHLKPDLEAVCEVAVPGGPAGVLLLGSGSSPRRRRGALVEAGPPPRAAPALDLGELQDRVAAALGTDPDLLNLEGACQIGDRLRWFHRGAPAAGAPSASVDLPLAEALRVAAGRGDAGALSLTDVRHYDLGSVEGVALAVTDALALPSGEVLVSAAAEDTDDPREDGPVTGSALALLAGGEVVAQAPLPSYGGRVLKVEGIALVATHGSALRLLATVDADDATAPSTAVELRVRP